MPNFSFDEKQLFTVLLTIYQRPNLHKKFVHVQKNPCFHCHCFHLETFFWNGLLNHHSMWGFELIFVEKIFFIIIIIPDSLAESLSFWPSVSSYVLLALDFILLCFIRRFTNSCSFTSVLFFKNVFRDRVNAFYAFLQSSLNQEGFCFLFLPVLFCEARNRPDSPCGKTGSVACQQVTNRVDSDWRTQNTAILHCLLELRILGKIKPWPSGHLY